MDKNIRVGPTKPNILETEVDGEISLYNAATEQVTVLNSSASDIWRLIDGVETAEGMVTLLSSSYGVPEETIREEVATTIESLADSGLIERQ